MIHRDGSLARDWRHVSLSQKLAGRKVQHHTRQEDVLGTLKSLYKTRLHF